MKPRLRFGCGLWFCFTPDVCGSMGTGRTPVMAYYEWLFDQKASLIKEII